MRFLLGILAYVVPTFALGFAWHLILFEQYYKALAIYRNDIIIPFGIVWNGNYVIESDLTFHYQPKPVAAATEADFNLARDCEGKLLPNTANRYNAAELFVLAFFRS